MRVSVIIATYNAARFLEAAIESVLTQTYKHYEVIVVDDGSTDNTPAIVAKFGKQCTYLWQANAGPSSARNHGISNSRGEVIAFLDADDAWLPNKLEAQVERLTERPEVGLLDTAYYLCDEKLYPVRYQPATKLDKNALEDMFENFKTPLTSSIVVRRELIQKVSGFDVSLRVMEDHDLCLRLAQLCEFDCLGDPHVYYRVHSANSLTNGRVILDTHIKISDHAMSMSPALAKKEIASRRHVEAFAIKIMCLQHRWRDAFMTIFHFWSYSPFCDAFKVSLYLIALTIPQSLIPSLRKMYWKLSPAGCN